ncbi:MAG: LysR family transcriptional regulator [Sneathiella sp.]|nr:LysR family transcriptional regulator [Sneathiella sp.]
MLNPLEELFCFAAICEKGSITAASRVLGRSKAHVSRKMKELEERVGTKLLHRTTRQITLTTEGSYLKDEALKLYRNGNLLCHKAMSLDSDLSGRFVITAPVSIATYLLAPIMASLQDTFPLVEFDLRPSNEKLDLITTGVDLAIRTGSVSDEDLIAHQIGVGRDILFRSTKNTVGAPPISDVTDLLHNPLFINPYSLHCEDLRLHKAGEAIELQPTHMTKVGEYPLLMDLVQRGNGIGLAPDYCVIGSEALEQVLPDWQGREWPILITYPFLAPLPIKLSKISAFLRQKLGDQLKSSFDK